MKNMGTGVALIVGIAILASVAAAAQGRGRGRGNGPPQTPPGQERKVHTVPEPATLTLLGVAVGSGFLVRRWTSKSKKTQS